MCAAGDADDDTVARGGASRADPRARAAWRSWLQAMASDADAALSAALAYRELAADGRAAWLDALREDIVGLDVPKVAVYAPLLAVEDDADRRAAIERALDADDDAPLPAAGGPCALAAEEADGTVVAVLASPLYLAFVELLVCRFHPDRGVAMAVHEPLIDRRALTADDGGFRCEGAKLSPAPLDDVVEGLALAILADRRRGVAAPSALERFAHLFTATPRRSAAPAAAAPPEREQTE